jgi:tetratricopeptide (TPR) repeat protein
LKAYNISLLLQVSKIAKDQTDHALSSDLVERALFTFGRAAQSLFATKLSQGKARLEFERPENREFWLAGYQYIRSLTMKGTYRTALEWAKLLLALEPEKDPYCMLLMVHHLALRAFESQYVLDVYENRTLGDWSTYVAYMSPSLALAAMQLKESARARSLLKQSIQRLPWLFCRLFQELNLDNPPPSIWGAEPRTDAENLFSEIYIRQTKDLWNTPEATSLLMEVTHASDKLNYQDLPILDNAKITLNVARFVYLDNSPALMAHVPSQLLHRSTNSDSDPLPPDRNIFSWDSQRMLFSRDGNSRGMDRDFGDHFDPIAALRALIPGLGNVPTGDREQPITDNELREFLETEVNRQTATAAAANSDDEVDEDEDEEEREAVHPRASGARRLYEFFFGSRTQEQSEDAQDEAETHPESHEQESEDH